MDTRGDNGRGRGGEEERREGRGERGRSGSEERTGKTQRSKVGEQHSTSHIHIGRRWWTYRSHLHDPILSCLLSRGPVALALDLESGKSWAGEREKRDVGKQGDASFQLDTSTLPISTSLQAISTICMGNKPHPHQPRSQMYPRQPRSQY